MSHVTTGIRRILELPFVYEAFQTLTGYNAFRKRVVKDFIQPFPGARILDIGCGTATILDCLPNNIEYVGVDLNPKYLEFARKRYKGNATFYCERVDDVVDKGTKLGRFDIAMANGILHHIGDNEAKNLFKGAHQYLTDTGRLITTDPVYIENQSAIARYLMSKDRGQNIRTPEEYLELAKTSFSPVENFIFTQSIILPYTIMIMRMSK